MELISVKGVPRQRNSELWVSNCIKLKIVLTPISRNCRNKPMQNVMNVFSRKPMRIKRNISSINPRTVNFVTTLVTEIVLTVCKLLRTRRATPYVSSVRLIIV